MRKAFNDYSILKDENAFYGISLGYDFCSEHEWGIKGIKQRFGIDKNANKLGIKNRTITKNDCIVFLKEGDSAILTTRSRKENPTFKDLVPYDLQHSYQGTELSTAWCEDDFCVIVSGETNVKMLEDLYEQFKKNNVAICKLRSSVQVFANSSLSLVIIDRLPKDAIDNLYQVDKKAEDLVKYENKIGMTKLKEKERGRSGNENYYMACSAKWIDYENEKNREARKVNLKTKYDIQYWVNYSDDDDNYGWYTVEEIRQWLSTPGLKLKQIRDGKNN